MDPKIFVDTNILIDFLEQRKFDLDNTNQLFKLIQENYITAFISETVITNALYITRMEHQILRLMNFVEIICIESHSIKTAMRSNFTDKEDAILYYGALDKGINYFITRNKKDFAKYHLKQLPVLNSKELLLSI